MTEPKSKPRKTTKVFDAPIESQIEGLRLTAQRKPQPGEDPLAVADEQIEIQPPEPSTVSKLINFIKKI